MYLSCIYRISIVYLSYIYRVSIVYLSCLSASSRLQMDCERTSFSEGAVLEGCSKGVAKKPIEAECFFYLTDETDYIPYYIPPISKALIRLS